MPKTSDHQESHKMPWESRYALGVEFAVMLSSGVLLLLIGG